MMTHNTNLEYRVSVDPEAIACLEWAYTFAQGTYDIPDDRLHNPGFEAWLKRCRTALHQARIDERRQLEELVARLGQREMKMTTYTVTMDNGFSWLMSADMSRSEKPLLANFHDDADPSDDDLPWQHTPYQTADSSHLTHKAAQMVYDYFREDPDDNLTVVNVDAHEE